MLKTTKQPDRTLVDPVAVLARLEELRAQRTRATADVVRNGGRSWCCVKQPREPCLASGIARKQRPEEVGHFIDEGGNNFWGVALAEDQNGDRIILASDRDFGLYIFRYTGPIPAP
jgi:hypothetical protein